jgi:hypothetical protein
LRVRALVLGMFSALVGAGCTAILGDYSQGTGGGDASTQDAAGGMDVGTQDGPESSDSAAGSDVSIEDAPSTHDGPVAQDGSPATHDGATSDGAFSDGPSSDGAGPTDAPPGDAPSDAAPCGALTQACCAGSKCTTGSCCGNTCMDTSADPHHCGSCTRDCLTGTCTASVCDPDWLASLNSGSSSSPEAVAVDSNQVYWVQTSGTGGSVDYAALSGGIPTPLVSGLTEPSGLLLANSNFYYNVYSSGTAECPIAGGCSSPSYIYTGGGRINYGFADTGGGGLVVVDRSGGNLVQFTYTGGSVVTLATGIAGEGATATGGQVFWADDGSGGNTGYIGKAQLSVLGSGASFVPNQASPHNMTSDATNIYWTVNSSDGVYQDMDVWSCPFKSCNVGTMQKLAAAQPDIGGNTLQSIASDGTNVYWTASKGSYGYVAGCAVGGCNQTPTILTQFTDPSAGVLVYFHGVTYDATWVYFGVGDGSTTRIGRVAK